MLCRPQEHIKREKALMAEFESPFLVALVGAFQVCVCMWVWVWVAVLSMDWWEL